MNFEADKAQRARRFGEFRKIVADKRAQSADAYDNDATYREMVFEEMFESLFTRLEQLEALAVAEAEILPQ